MSGYAPRACGPAQPIRASEIRPGDRVTVGDHTGWLRVWRVTVFEPEPHEEGFAALTWVEVRWWWFGRRIVPADTLVWVIRP